MSGTTFSELSVNGAASDIGLSDDRKAFTITFSDVQVETGNVAGNTTTTAGRLVQVAALVDGAEAGTEITFAVSGYVIAEEGASARLCLRTGGETRLVDFPAGSDRSFLVPVTCSLTGAESAVSLDVCAVVERNGREAGAAFLSINPIDGNIPVAGPQPEQAMAAAAT